MKYKYIILISICFLASNLLQAQVVSNVAYEVKGSEIWINYKINNAKFNQKFDVSLYVSFDGGKSFQGPMKAITGDIFEGVKGGENRMVWSPFKDVHSMDGEIVFDVKAQIIDEKIEKHFYFAYSGGISLSNSNYITPIGFQLGILAKTGFYVSARLNGFTSSDFTYNGTSITDYSSGSNYYEFTDQTKYPRFSATAGITKQLAWNIYLYGGAGYGYKKLLWHINEFDYTTDSQQGDAYVDYEEYTTSGFEVEAGLIFRLKAVALNIGVSSLRFSDTGITAGIGLNF